MKGKLLASLFALPFLGVGVWQMQSWVPVDARLLRAGYETHVGDDSDTYEAFAEYQYTYLGERYTGERGAISKGADNIGDYQRDIARRLNTARTQGETITVFVNPNQPTD